MSALSLEARNKRLGLIVLGVVACMVALSFAAVPLYSLFCRAVGWGGTATQAERPATDQILARKVEVRFNADVDARLPWTFKPVDRTVTLQIGQEGFTSFIAENNGKEPITGTAVFNVLPEKAGKYFHKTQCFCFGEQVLTPGQKVEMPVLFYVDPALDHDPNMQDIEVLTLSYTFYRAESPELDAALRAFAGD